jgi:hypothetical protein
MKLITSNFPPLETSNDNFPLRWSELFFDSDFITLGVGYASNDSLLYLLRLLEINEKKNFNICLGMAYFDGLSRSQFEAIEKISSFLEGTKTGQFYIARTFPFHGKVYHFGKNSKSSTSLIGSSNFSNIVPIKGIEQRSYEVDFEIDDPLLNQSVSNFLSNLLHQASVPFSEIRDSITVKENKNPLLEFRSDIEKVDSERLDLIQSKAKGSTFEVPLKDAQRSNLNVYFGKGRKSQQNYVTPRPWYEVEIIVDISVQKSSKNYPANEEFIAYTDDGYRIAMKTSGDYGKNLRSRDDLSILGRWIKGRLETSSCLKSGELVTEETLAKYGRETITLRKTSLTEKDLVSGHTLEVWFMDFGTTLERPK